MSAELLSPEEVRSALRGYFADVSALDEARALRDDARDDAFDGAGFDRDRWRALAGEVGLVAMAAPEEEGGLGLGLVHLAAALEEAGACLYPGPVRASVLAAWTLGLPGTGRPGGAEELLDGTAIAGMPQSFAAHRPRAVLSADGTVSGTVPGVTHGMSADALLTLADSAQGPVPVLARLDGAAEPPTEVGLAAYRIVQESLTNVSRHAAAAEVVVSVEDGAGGLVVEVADDGRGASGPSGAPGSGVDGMRARAHALGGELTAGPRPGGGFLVRATLPYREAS